MFKFLDNRQLPLGSFEPLQPTVLEQPFGWMCLHGAGKGDWTGIQMEIDWLRQQEADLGELELLIRIGHEQGSVVYHTTETCHKRGTMFVDYETRASEDGDVTYFFSFMSKTNSAVVTGPLVIRGYIEQDAENS